MVASVLLLCGLEVKRTPISHRRIGPICVCVCGCGVRARAQAKQRPPDRVQQRPFVPPPAQLPGSCRWIYHTVFCAGMGVSLSPLIVVSSTSNLLIAGALTGGISVGMLVYGLHAPPGSLLRWAPFIYCGFAGIGVLGLTMLLSWLFFPGLVRPMSFIVSLIAVPLFSALIAFDVNTALYKYQAFQEADHMGDSIGIYLDILNLFIAIVDLLENK